jgi:hypothetical protein
MEVSYQGGGGPVTRGDLHAALDATTNPQVLYNLGRDSMSPTHSIATNGSCQSTSTIQFRRRVGQVGCKATPESRSAACCSASLCRGVIWNALVITKSALVQH